nr:immunoglobulin light chain junction region [Macaca mulatta]MOY00624.1 immunoglobulin light chain junction region [Macaca mulatta]
CQQHNNYPPWTF